MSQISTAKKRILKPSVSSNKKASSNKNTAQYALNNLLSTLAQVQSNISRGIHDSIEIIQTLLILLTIDNELMSAALAVYTDANNTKGSNLECFFMV
jgi:hypothetical protein